MPQIKIILQNHRKYFNDGIVKGNRTAKIE